MRGRGCGRRRSILFRRRDETRAPPRRGLWGRVAAHNEGHVSDPLIFKNVFYPYPSPPIMVMNKPPVLIRRPPREAVPRPSGKTSARPRARWSEARAQARASGAFSFCYGRSRGLGFWPSGARPFKKLAGRWSVRFSQVQERSGLKDSVTRAGETNCILCLTGTVALP